eukprot:15355827-Alexandrium_andersonii.AAC.1
MRECRRRVRSPLVLWRLLHAGPPPRQFTGGQLTQRHTVAHLAQLLQAGGREIARLVASWNV